MNKFILIALVGVATMAYMEVSFARLLDDYIRYPTTRFRHDIEREELHGAGDDPVEASRRAVDRIKRMNREEEVAIYKRFSGGMGPPDGYQIVDEDDEENRPIGCITDDVIARKKQENEKKCLEPECYYPAHIKIFLDINCRENTNTYHNFITVLTYFNIWSDCKFDEDFFITNDQTNADITVTCTAGEGNYCPIGKSVTYIGCNMAPGKNGIVSSRIIYHEFGHLCGLDHTQKQLTNEYTLRIISACVRPKFLHHYIVSKCDARPRTLKLKLLLTSFMEYKANRFLMPDCEKNIEVMTKRFSQQALRINKKPDIPDFLLISHCSVLNQPEPPRDTCERGEMTIGGQTILYIPATEATDTVVTVEVTSCSDSVSKEHQCYSDAEDISILYQCSGDTFTLNEQIWMVKDKCSKKTVKLVSGWNCYIDTISEMCESMTERSATDKMVLHGGWLVLKGSCTSGFINLNMTCCNSELII